MGSTYSTEVAVYKRYATMGTFDENGGSPATSKSFSEEVEAKVQNALQLSRLHSSLKQTERVNTVGTYFFSLWSNCLQGCKGTYFRENGFWP